MTIAAVVGVILTAINEGDLLIRGRLDTSLAFKLPLNFLVPFLVSNLGLLSSRRTD